MKKFTALFLVVFLSACTLSTPAGTETPVITEEATQAATLLPTRTDLPNLEVPHVTVTSINNILPTANPLFTETPLPIGIRAVTDSPPQVTVAVTTVVAPTTVIPTAGVTSIATSTLATTTSEFTFPSVYPTVNSVTLRQGQTLLVNYDVTIFNPGQGRVYIVVRDPSGEDIYRLVVTETTKETAEVPVEEGGQFEILAAPENISGQYSISYGFRN